MRTRRLRHLIKGDVDDGGIHFQDIANRRLLCGCKRLKGSRRFAVGVARTIERAIGREAKSERRHRPLHATKNTVNVNITGGRITRRCGQGRLPAKVPRSAGRRQLPAKKNVEPKFYESNQFKLYLVRVA